MHLGWALNACHNAGQSNCSTKYKYTHHTFVRRESCLKRCFMDIWIGSQNEERSFCLFGLFFKRLQQGLFCMLCLNAITIYNLLTSLCVHTDPYWDLCL